HTRYWRDWSSDVCSSDLVHQAGLTFSVGAHVHVDEELSWRRIFGDALSERRLHAVERLAESFGLVARRRIVDAELANARREAVGAVAADLEIGELGLEGCE